MRNIHKIKVFTVGISSLLFIAVFLFSCNEKKAMPTSDNLISIDSMVPILIDIHIADALLSDIRLHDKDLHDSTRSYYNYVFKKHEISRMQFDSSMRYYGESPKILLDIYDEVLKQMSITEGKLEHVEKK